MNTKTICKVLNRFQHGKIWYHNALNNQISICQGDQEHTHKKFHCNVCQSNRSVTIQKHLIII